MSVWRVNLKCQSNFASGIYFEDTNTSRQFDGFFYTEANGLDLVSWGCYLGGLSSSQLYIYSEEQGTNQEINLPLSGGDGNFVFSGRADSDVNGQINSKLYQGSRELNFGSTGETVTNSFVNLTDNVAKYWDFKQKTSVNNIFQERFYGSGLKSSVVADGSYTSGFSEFEQSENNINFRRSNGTPEAPTKVTATESWSFNFSADTSDSRTISTNFASIKATAISVGGGNKGSGKLTFGVANVTPTAIDWIELDNAGKFYPVVDTAQKLGGASNRWDTVYAVTGTINTSDEDEKTGLLDLEEAELAVAQELKSSIKKFKFKNAVEVKGDGARIHVGVGAQTVKNIFEKHGLDASKYALFCYDEWEAEDAVEPEVDKNGIIVSEGRPRKEAGSRYGVRYEELLAFIVASL